MKVKDVNPTGLAAPRRREDAAGNELVWLATAFERHLAQLAARGYRKSRDCFPFDGANESAVILIADRVFAGLGFLTWPERRVYEDEKQRADLWAESPAGSEAFLIEGKVVWDGVDKRLNRKRYMAKRELLGDFERLACLRRAATKVVVWIVFSPTADIVALGSTAKGMRLGDALATVSSECPSATLQGSAAVHLDQFGDCPDWKVAHVFCWSVARPVSH